VASEGPELAVVAPAKELNVGARLTEVHLMCSNSPVQVVIAQLVRSEDRRHDVVGIELLAVLLAECVGRRLEDVLIVHMRADLRHPFLPVLFADDVASVQVVDPTTRGRLYTIVMFCSVTVAMTVDLPHDVHES